MAAESVKNNVLVIGEAGTESKNTSPLNSTNPIRTSFGPKLNFVLVNCRTKLVTLLNTGVTLPEASKPQITSIASLGIQTGDWEGLAVGVLVAHWGR